MLPMETERSRVRLRRWTLRIGAIALGVTIVLLLVGWLSYRHIPSWYRPAYVPIEEEQAARDELGAAFTGLSRGMGQGEPFDYTVRQDELNRWLVARERIWPASKRWIPEAIDDPVVVFRQDEVIVAGTWCGPGPRTVVSIHLRVEMDGDRLRAVVESVRGGSLPIPLGPIKQQLARLEQDRSGRDRPLLPNGTSIVDAIEGAPLPRDLPWSQPRGEFRIEALKVVPGELRVRLRPIPRRRSDSSHRRRARRD